MMIETLQSEIKQTKLEWTKEKTEFNKRIEKMNDALEK